MNKLLITAAVVVLPFSAFADVATDGLPTFYPGAFVSQVSRAEVSAETARARANGEMMSGELSYVALPVGPALSRAEVLLALDDARRNGEMDSGEFSFVAESVIRVLPQVARR